MEWKTEEDFSLFVHVTLLSFCSAFYDIATKLILPIFMRKSSEETTLISELRELKFQLTKLSMVDEFAKYAKIERRILKLKEELKEKGNKRITNTTKIKIGINMLVRVLLLITIIILLWTHRYDPVLYVSEDWFYPFSGVLTWPTGQSGAISVSAWLCISGTTFRTVAAALN